MMMRLTLIDHNERSSRRSRKQNGAAAVELALFMLLLVCVLVLTAPLALILKEQLKLGRTAGRTVRFASATPDTARRDCAGARLARRPSTAQVVSEASCSHFGTGSVPAAFSVSVSPQPNSAAPGTQITVTVSNQVSLGPLGGLLSIVGIDESYSSPTLSATAVSVEE